MAGLTSGGPFDPALPPSASMRIGEVAAALGVSADTIRFYEKEGWLPGPPRAGNAYRQYGPEDVEHIRMLLELRRLDLSLEDAARLASWCHSGHCSATTSALPPMVAERRRSIAERIERLQELDARLSRLESHLRRTSKRNLPTLDAAAGPCCDSAEAVGSLAGGCRCCTTA